MGEVGLRVEATSALSEGGSVWVRINNSFANNIDGAGHITGLINVDGVWLQLPSGRTPPDVDPLESHGYWFETHALPVDLYVGLVPL